MTLVSILHAINAYVFNLLASWSVRDELRVKRINSDAILPTRGSCGSVGLDLYSIDDITIAPKGLGLVGTGLVFTLPSGTYGRIAPRSGLSTKGIDVMAGVIDPDYKGEVKVLLLNLNDEPYKFSKGQRISQFILEKAAFPRVKETWEVEETQRGDGGFGSTG